MFSACGPDVGCARQLALDELVVEVEEASARSSRPAPRVVEQRVQRGPA